MDTIGLAFVNTVALNDVSFQVTNSDALGSPNDIRKQDFMNYYAPVQLKDARSAVVAIRYLACRLPDTSDKYQREIAITLVRTSCTLQR